MPNHSFTLLVDRADLLSYRALDALYEAGCDDATFGERGPIQYADFNRERATLTEAIITAIGDIEGAVDRARVVRIEPDEFVSLSAIAKRTGRSRESIRLLSEGLRGPGGFPAPERWVDARTTVWHWAEVAEWFEQRLGETVARSEDANVIAALNGLLEARRHIAQLPAGPKRKTAAFARKDADLGRLLVAAGG
jgi:predicted DNA-binding transcriptional regulator AlpA